MSPMLAILMQENTEEEESIYIDGSTLAVLQALKHFLYNGKILHKDYFYDHSLNIF